MTPLSRAPWVDASIRVTPMRRFAEEAEVSSAITYRLSPAAAYLTGICIRIDGVASLCGVTSYGDVDIEGSR